MNSNSISDDEEKIELLGKYYSVDENLVDAEYAITYHDNSGGMVPGPSDYHFTFALKFKDLDSIQHLTRNLNEIPIPFDVSSWDALELDQNQWKTYYTKTYYTSAQKRVVVIPDQKIVLIEASTMMLSKTIMYDSKTEKSNNKFTNSKYLELFEGVTSNQNANKIDTIKISNQSDLVIQKVFSQDSMPEFTPSIQTRWFRKTTTPGVFKAHKGFYEIKNDSIYLLSSSDFKIDKDAERISQSDFAKFEINKTRTKCPDTDYNDVIIEDSKGKTILIKDAGNCFNQHIYNAKNQIIGTYLFSYHTCAGILEIYKITPKVSTE